MLILFWAIFRLPVIKRHHCCFPSWRYARCTTSV
uniref:Uncharacterized protein n=2 Tax=unclassified Caudoviricetes TaxID=2788787 RepID=A0AAU8GG07_9CAUD